MTLYQQIAINPIAPDIAYNTIETVDVAVGAVGAVGAVEVDGIGADGTGVGA